MEKTYEERLAILRDTDTQILLRSRTEDEYVFLTKKIPADKGGKTYFVPGAYWSESQGFGVYNGGAFDLSCYYEASKIEKNFVVSMLREKEQAAITIKTLQGELEQEKDLSKQTRDKQAQAENEIVSLRQKVDNYKRRAKSIQTQATNKEIYMAERFGDVSEGLKFVEDARNETLEFIGNLRWAKRMTGADSVGIEEIAEALDTELGGPLCDLEDWLQCIDEKQKQKKSRTDYAN